MSLMRFDPFSDFMSFRDTMNRLMEEGFTRPTGVTMGTTTFPMDMYETDSDVFIKCAMPGVRPEDVDISVTGDTVTIRGRMFSEAENKEAQNWDWYRHELSHGQFMRSVTLPTRVDADKAEATFENGILTLRLPKSEEVKPKRVSVQSKGQERQLHPGEGFRGETSGMTQRQTGSRPEGQSGQMPQGRA